MTDIRILRRLLEAQGSRFTAVEFIKQDGSLRRMLIQPAATKFHVKGEDASPSHAMGALMRRIRHPNLFNVYDVDRRAIRSVNLDTLLKVRGRGRDLFVRPHHEIVEMLKERAHEYPGKERPRSAV